MTATPRKQILITAAIGGVIILALGLYKGVQIYLAANAPHMMPPEAVTTIMADEQEWPSLLSSMGTLAASRGVIVKSEEPGVVRQIYFDSGGSVQGGKPLIELDTTVEEADLAGALAAVDRTKSAAVRAKKLIDSKAISVAEYEQATTQMREAQATAESLRARIARKKITAPFDGQTGIRMVNVGQYLSAGDNVVPLYTLDPLYLNFSLPQKVVKDLQVGFSVTVLVDVFPGEKFKGTLTAINPQISEVTRNIELQATVPNTDMKLRPGMFGEVTLVLPQVDKYITIPSSSVYSLPYADTIYVLEKPKEEGAAPTVRQQIVKLGSRRGNQIAILSGLNKGEEVVTSGAFKLRPGLSVNVNNEIAPSNDPAPQPPDT